MGDEGRGLLSEREKDLLGRDTGEPEYAHEVESRVRGRVLTRVPDDVAFLEAHLPELHKKLVTDICGRPPGEVDEPSSADRGATDASVDASTRVARLRDELEDCRAELHDLRNELTKADLRLMEAGAIDGGDARSRLDELEAAYDRDDGDAVERCIRQLREALDGGSERADE